MAASDRKREDEAAAWLRANLKAEDSVTRVAGLCSVVWQALVDGKNLAELLTPDVLPTSVAGKTVEAALLDRKLPGAVQYRLLELK